MSRGKIIICAVAALASAMFVALLACRQPIMRSKLERVREGMTYDQIVTVLGRPDPRDWISDTKNWTGPDGTIRIFFSEYPDGHRASWVIFDEVKPPTFVRRVAKLIWP